LLQSACDLLTALDLINGNGWQLVSMGICIVAGIIRIVLNLSQQALAVGIYQERFVLYLASLLAV
jgi:hypothetical protein